MTYLCAFTQKKKKITFHRTRVNTIAFSSHAYKVLLEIKRQKRNRIMSTYVYKHVTNVQDRLNTGRA